MGNADRTEGLITNLGVINALVLAFSLPLLVSVDMEVFDRQDFRDYLFKDMEFRKFAIFVMDQEDIGTYKPEAFSWNVVTGVNKTVNVKAILLQSATLDPQGLQLWEISNDIRNLYMAIEALIAKFPMWQLHTWRAQQSGIV